jgi:hypothetical protein
VPDLRQLTSACRALGADLVVTDLAVGDGSPRHDPARLALAYARLLLGA